MSYASITAQNTLPPEQQPKPDPNLLEGSNQSYHQISSSDSNHPPSNGVPNEEYKETEEGSDQGKTPTKKKSNQKTKRMNEEIEKGSKKARRELSKAPQVKLDVLKIINLGVLSTVGILMFKNWDQKRWDRRIISASVIGLGVWFSSQGYLAGLVYDQKKRNL
ncbi:hypothetical protein DFH28DRAFT_956181 [Melampsora americana]|nr:hypothetical protein DFH28DRAFT_956181 [Melampsora americana]